ncbi:MAG: Spy/CpxP family protein refolding chaperone [Acidobacteria bacterium]|jgi:Spy/CpxP family protein refolding chaperone|nr:Spy/CpxP family protein refolding chaperone [Acidobacteriota bacterium]
MTRFAARIALIGVLFCLPLCALAQEAKGGADAQDPVDSVLSQLGLTPDQHAKVEKLVAAFKEKQQALPTPGDVLLKDKELAKQLISGASFDRVKADQLTKAASSAIQARMVNRMELRNQIFQVLTPQQREQYMKKVMQAMAKGQ